MSQHHRNSKHTSGTYQLRPELEARLPLPCTECGKPVHREQKWHVAHLTPASKGGRTTRQNTGVAHAICNLKAGGKLGAKATNGRRRSSSAAREGIRPW
ncbi:HNH endonuclease [Microbacterium sp. NPDC077057]|uniref:HNH endonuclease n=1 Tax=Microbacterium sp. NPDC077057 TaxID=3154763 RepID=UPI00342E8B0A